jgi:thiamine biosynthesis lipoprotein
MKKKSKLFIIVTIIIHIFIFSKIIYRLTHPAPWPKDRISVSSPTRTTMGTFARVVAVAPNEPAANAAINAAFDQLILIDELMSDYSPISELSIINKNAFRNPLPLSPQLFEVLQKSIEFSQISSGAFDITVGPLVDLYAQAEKDGLTPSEDQIAEAKKSVGYDKLILDAENKTISFAVEDMRLDLGGIAKGYAIDLAIEAAQKAGAIGVMIDVGGDIRCLGAPPPEKDSWLIGLQNPDIEADAKSSYSMVLKINDTAVATSGDYRRFYEVAGQKYSHIFDTKKPAGDSELSSVTIIAPTAIQADALATAVTVLGAAEGIKLIESLPEAEAILIPSDDAKKIIKTKNAQKYIQ